MPIQRLHTDARMSQIVIHRGTVYLAGQLVLVAIPAAERHTF